MQRTRQVVLGLTLAISFAVTGAASASATTFFIAPTGNDANPCTASSAPCKTIASAISKAGLDPGASTLEVAAGKYEETLKLSVALEGITVNGAGGGPGGTEIIGSAAAKEDTINSDASGATVSNLSIVNAAGNTYGGISGGQDLTLRNVFVDMRNPGGEDGISYGALTLVGVLTMEGGSVTLESGTKADAIDAYAYPIDLKGVAITVADGSTGSGIYGRVGSLAVSNSTLTLGNTAESVAISAGYGPVSLTNDTITTTAPKGAVAIEGTGAEPLNVNNVNIAINGAPNTTPAVVLQGGTANLLHLNLSTASEGPGVLGVGSTLTLADSRLTTTQAPAVESIGYDGGRGTLVQRSVLHSSGVKAAALLALDENLTVDSSEILGGQAGVYVVNEGAKSRTATIAASTIDAGELGVSDASGIYGVYAAAAGGSAHLGVSVEGSILLEPQFALAEPGATAEVTCSNSDAPSQSQPASGKSGSIACAAGASANTSNSPAALFAAPITSYIPGSSSPAVNSVPSSAISLPFGIAPSTTDLAGNPRSVLIGSNGICPAFQDRGALQIPGQQGSCTPAKAPTPPPPVAGIISGLAISPSAFSAAPAGATISKAKRKYGAQISYRDSQVASTTFTVSRQSAGRKQSNSCRRPSSSNKHGKRCVILTAAGTFSHSDAAGANSLHFSGRLHSSRLSAGTYVLSARARDAAGYGPTATRGFAIR
jgi:hypothetical protein